MRHSRWKEGALTLGLAFLVGCNETRGAGVPRQPQAAVDTIHPADVSLQRFRADLPEPAVALAGGEPTIGTLVTRWTAAIESHDTATLRRLVVDRADFAWTYYPTSMFSRPPLYQPPDLLWFRLQANSEKGITRVLRRFGGSALGYRDVECPRPPRVEGRNRIWEYCEIRREDGGATRSDQLFGGILEHEGRFKFITYSNQF